LCDECHARYLGLLDFTFIFEKQAQIVDYFCTHSPVFLKFSNFVRYATNGLEGMWECELADIYEERRKTLKRMSHNAGRFGAI